MCLLCILLVFLLNPQAVSRTKRLDDELELSALLNLGSKRSSGNVVAVRLQQHALITALANRRLDSATIATLTGKNPTAQPPHHSPSP